MPKNKIQNLAGGRREDRKKMGAVPWEEMDKRKKPEGERWARALHTPGEGSLQVEDTALWTVTTADPDCWKAVGTCDDLTGCGQQKPPRSLVPALVSGTDKPVPSGAGAETQRSAGEADERANQDSTGVGHVLLLSTRLQPRSINRP